MNLRVHQITWNVASTYPLKDELYEALFCVDKNSTYRFGQYPDIIVINFQEQTVALIENYWESTFKNFFRKLKAAKGINYIKIRSNSIFYLYQYVFVDFALLRTCKRLETHKFSNYAGVTGKGTIVFKFNIENESFAFLTAHLSAHDFNNSDRIRHYKRVINENIFYDFSRILECSYSFYVGDLNFRLINLNTIELINDLNEKGKDEKFLESLYENDQLKIAQQNNEAFNHFEEGKIKFKPTFKFYSFTDNYNAKRTPSWCDRILYRSKQPNKCKLIHYDSISIYNQSDHKPVIGVFDLKTNIKTIVPKFTPKIHLFSPSQIDIDNKLDLWLAKKIQPSLLTANLLKSGRTDHTDSVIDERNQRTWDWIGLFKDDFNDLDDYLAYLYVEDVPNSEGPPEDIMSKISQGENTEEIFELKTAKNSKEVEISELTENQPSCSSLKSDESKYNYKEFNKIIEWSKLEFSEQTFTQPGQYLLIYFNSDGSVEYISESFEVTAN